MMMRRRLVGSVLALLLLPVGILAPVAAVASSPADCDVAGTACHDLYIVAHEDDDLLFMSPDIPASIESGHSVRTLYVTAGDHGEGSTTNYWRHREDGERDAYAAMAGVANVWTKSTPKPGVHLYTLQAAPQISLAFLRLHENSPNGDLTNLWAGTFTSIEDIFGVTTYTRQQLIDRLTQQISSYQADRVNVLDSSGIDWFEYGSHSDHVSSSLFALAGRAAYTGAHALRTYRDYNIRFAPANVSGAEHTLKDSIFFDSYGAHDFRVSRNDDYTAWVARQYRFVQIAGKTGALGGLVGKCIGVTGDTAGSAIVLTKCGKAPAVWTTTQQGQIKSAGGLCVSTPDAALGTAALLANCAGVSAQKWTLLTSGQIRGPLTDCLAVDGASSADGTPLVIASCNDGPEQRWSYQLKKATKRSDGTDFSDTDIGSSATYWGTVRLADVNDDGRADACVRRAAGVACAVNNGSGTFSALAPWTTEFSDVKGWNDAQYGRTIQTGDVNGDGRADVCGRGTAGVSCAVANASGTGFTDPHVWTTDFSDAQGYGAAEDLYLTFRVTDVNGDGYADLCSRAAAGVKCALNDTIGGFAPAALFTSQFSDGAGWNSGPYGSTLQFGDINGDGEDDVCGRGANGIVCAVANVAGDGFDDLDLASSSDDFSDAAGWAASVSEYRSIRLADVNGDEYADVCGRTSAGILCAFSRPRISPGPQFTEAVAIAPRAFNKAEWQQESTGTTIQFADIDGDARIDACARGTSGLQCTNK
jgi:hypothetical protein